MANNTIGWGQGSVNNSNGWGSGAASNNIGWGYIHALSYGHPETNLVGLSDELLSFEESVIADGGEVFSLYCAM